MARVFKFVTMFVLLIRGISCADIPVGKCKLDDEACMKDAFQKTLSMFMAGVPDWAVEVLDTMPLDDLSYELAGLSFSLKEGKLKGMKGAEVQNVNWDTKKNRFVVDFNADLTVKGHYTAAGQLLILPITGDGEMKIKLKKIHVTQTIHFSMENGDDGKKHVKPSKYEFKFEIIDNAHFDLTGLFNGNKELSDPMLAFLNENWKRVVEEFGGPVIDAATKKIFKNMIKFFKKHAIEDIAEV